MPSLWQSWACWQTLRDAVDDEMRPVCGSIRMRLWWTPLYMSKTVTIKAAFKSLTRSPAPFLGAHVSCLILQFCKAWKMKWFVYTSHLIRKQITGTSILAQLQGVEEKVAKFIILPSVTGHLNMSLTVLWEEGKLHLRVLPFHKHLKGFSSQYKCAPYQPKTEHSGSHTDSCRDYEQWWRNGVQRGSASSPLNKSSKEKLKIGQDWNLKTRILFHDQILLSKNVTLLPTKLVFFCAFLFYFNEQLYCQLLVNICIFALKCY